VHRDLKPSNMFLAARKGKDPILKVLDFGIVKDKASDSRLTATGTLPGTPAYMAPEQITLQEDLINERADVWALGITLYELLTGDVPFTGQMNEMLTKIRSEAPPRLRARRPDVALELEALIMKCLSKHPADRYANAGELMHALRDLRQFGLVRSERGHARREVATEMSIARRENAPTEADPRMPEKAGARPAPPGHSAGRLLAVTILIVTVCAVVALVLALQGRLSPR
jgi:serine/threonine-protein kinase